MKKLNILEGICLVTCRVTSEMKPIIPSSLIGAMLTLSTQTHRILHTLASEFLKTAGEMHTKKQIKWSLPHGNFLTVSDMIDSGNSRGPSNVAHLGECGLALTEPWDPFQHPLHQAYGNSPNLSSQKGGWKTNSPK